MYIYSFTHYARYDRVFLASDCPGKPGDLLQSQDEFSLVLGSDVAYPENIKHTRNYSNHIVHTAKFFSSQTLAWIYRIVQNYYSSYKNVIKLFIGPDIQLLLSHDTKKKHKPMYHSRHWQESEQKFSLGDDIQNGQQLIVFPDLRTIYTTIPEILHNKASIRHSAMTNIQQAKIFCSCKSAKTTTLCTTHAGIFQDRRKLQSIICLDPFKRYYQSHQDPRYKIKSTLEKLATLYDAQLQWIHDW